MVTDKQADRQRGRWTERKGTRQLDRKNSRHTVEYWVCRLVESLARMYVTGEVGRHTIRITSRKTNMKIDNEISRLKGNP